MGLQTLLKIHLFSPKILSSNALKDFQFISNMTLFGNRFVFIPSGCSVEVYSVESGDKIHSLRKHRSAIVGIAVKDEDTLFSCDKSGKVFEWDIKTGEFLKVIFGIVLNTLQFLIFLF